MEGPVTIGIAGHVDHGKTTLVRSLTGIDTDRMKEEKRRGLSINFGVAPVMLPSGLQVSLIDVPGHTDFMKNTIRGLHAVTAAVLVVAADDGVMPQTREHLEILRYFGVDQGFVVLSKADLVDAETEELATLEVYDLTTGSFLENCPVIPFHGSTGMGREKIIQTLESFVVTKSRTKDLDKPFRFFIDQVRIFQGLGTVVSGTILSGVLRQGDTIEIIPGGLTARVRSLERHHEAKEHETAGSRVGINLQGISSQKITRGMVLAQPGSLTAERFFNAEVSLSRFSRESIKTGQRVKVYLGTAHTGAFLVIMEGQRLDPGETGLVQLRLNEPIGAIPGDRFVITPLNTSIITGGGVVLEATRSKFRKTHAMRVVPFLKAVQDQDLCGIMNAALNDHPERAVSAEDLGKASGIAPDLFEKLMSREESEGRLICVNKKRYLLSRTFQRIKNDIVAFVEKTLKEDTAKEHVSAAGIKSSFRQGIEPGVIDLVLSELIREHALIAVDRGYSIQSVYQKRAAVRERLIKQTLCVVEDSGSVPVTVPAVRDQLERVQEKRDVQKMLEHLVGCGDIVRLGNDRYLSCKGLEIIKDQVKKRIIKHGRMTLADCTDVLGYGRTVGASVLEYLDSIGYTLRCGNERILKA